VPIPSAIIYVIAGWAGMSVVTFLILDLIGSLMWAGMLAGLGYELGHHAVVVAQTISHYGLWFSLAIIAVDHLLPDPQRPDEPAILHHNSSPSGNRGARELISGLTEVQARVGPCRHRPLSSASRPRQSRYHALSAAGSVPRMKYPPIPSTRSMSLSCPGWRPDGLASRHRRLHPRQSHNYLSVDGTRIPHVPRQATFASLVA